MIQWTKDLELGVAKIDNQHQELIKLVNKVLDACNQGKGKETVGEALIFAMSYTKTHFKSEEDLMQQKGYKDYSTHKKAHENFVADVTILKKEFDQVGPKLQVVIKLNKLLVDWLSNHIRTKDKALAAFLNSSN